MNHRTNINLQYSRLKSIFLMQPFDWMLRGDGRVWKPILVSSTTILIIGVVMGILHATSMNPSSLFLHLLFECLTCFFCIFGFQCLCLTFSIFCVGYGRLIAQSLVFCSTIIGFVIGAIILVCNYIIVVYVLEIWPIICKRLFCGK